MSELTQTSKVLKMLWKAGKRGVPNYKFYENRILRPSARIAELRADGYNIVAERQQLPNGRYTGIWFYKLIEEDKKKWWERG